MIETVLPAARADDLQRQLPGLTGGEGVLDSTFAGYQPVSGTAPTRRRTTAEPAQPRGVHDAVLAAIHSPLTASAADELCRDIVTPSS